MKKNSLSTIEVAELLGVSRLTVNNWVRNNKLDSYTTPGGHYRIQKKDLDIFLRENNCPPVKVFEEHLDKILIVDDQEEILETLSDMVGSCYADVSVKTADNGFDAGRYVLTYEPDLVILDIGMQNPDGFEVCRKVKQDPATEHIKVIMMTGLHGEDLKDKANTIGADGFLTKPIGIMELKKEINSLFNNEKQSVR
ncbi:MAG: response regulator [bacterium]|nr:response regulator [bacterium]